MKANKVTLTITVEVLHIDAAPRLLADVISNIRGEFISGRLASEDGDTVMWDVRNQEVML